MAERPKVKRKLLDDLNAGPSAEKKKSKICNANEWRTHGRPTQPNGKLDKMVLNKTKKKSSTKSKSKNLDKEQSIDNNNNAVPESERGVNKNKNKSKTGGAFMPVIQTRRMKAAQQLADFEKNELELFNQIDRLNDSEIAGGDQVFEEDDDSNSVLHDEVVLSVNGSDDDQFTEEVSQTENEPGEVQNSSSDGEDTSHNRSQAVASKVVKIRKRRDRSESSDRFKKFKSLKDDPDFHDFLKELLTDDDNDTRKKGRSKSASTKDRQQQQQHGELIHDHDQSFLSPPHQVQRQLPLIKSPSDTTIYRPGLRKMSSAERE